MFGLDRPLAPSELGGENPWIIQRKARILEVEVYKHHTFSISQLVVYDETEFRLKQSTIYVVTPLGYFGDSISREVFLESPDCQAILN